MWEKTVECVVGRTDCDISPGRGSTICIIDCAFQVKCDFVQVNQISVVGRNDKIELWATAANLWKHFLVVKSFIIYQHWRSLKRIESHVVYWVDHVWCWTMKLWVNCIAVTTIAVHFVTRRSCCWVSLLPKHPADFLLQTFCLKWLTTMMIWL